MGALRKVLLAVAACGAAAASLAVCSGPAWAASNARSRGSSSLPSKAKQIATLKAAETKIRAEIKAAGAMYAYYGDISLGDLRSFGIEQLWNRGIDGAGTTVAVIEGWRDPGIQRAMNTLDRTYHLPDAHIRTIYPAGPLPKKCPAGMVALENYGSCSAWMGELALDVASVHLFAPYARIVISATPADTEIEDDTSSQVAPPEMMKALEYIGEHHVANVISISTGTNEGDYSHGKPEILAQDPGLLTAAEYGVPVSISTGDCGAAQELSTGNGFCNKLTSGRAIATWGDSPFATAVGGVTPAYTYKGPGGQDAFSVWNIGVGAESAGVSKVYRRPSYQNRVAKTIGSDWRAVPDITMDAQDGTSEAAPEFAGVLALATQLHGGNLGPINHLLYDRLGPAGSRDGVIDVRHGNNTIDGIEGYSAGRGYDIATGWGTVNASRFVPALARAIAKRHGLGSLATQAARRLTRLEHTARVRPSKLGAEGTLTVTSTGFLPEHPVHVSVAGRAVKVVTADGQGRLDFMLPVARLHVRAGWHTLVLKGMLLRQAVRFRVVGG